MLFCADACHVKKLKTAQLKLLHLVSTAASHLFRSCGHFCVSCSADNPTGVRQRSLGCRTGRVTERKGWRSRRKGERRAVTVREWGMQRERRRRLGQWGRWDKDATDVQFWVTEREEEEQPRRCMNVEGKEEDDEDSLKTMTGGLEHLHVFNARKMDKVEGFERDKEK